MDSGFRRNDGFVLSSASRFIQAAVAARAPRIGKKIAKNAGAAIK